MWNFQSKQHDTLTTKGCVQGSDVFFGGRGIPQKNIWDCYLKKTFFRGGVGLSKKIYFVGWGSFKKSLLFYCSTVLLFYFSPVLLLNCFTVLFFKFLIFFTFLLFPLFPSSTLPRPVQTRPDQTRKSNLKKSKLLASWFVNK